MRLWGSLRLSCRRKVNVQIVDGMEALAKRAILVSRRLELVHHLPGHRLAAATFANEPGKGQQ